MKSTVNHCGQADFQMFCGPFVGTAGHLLSPGQILGLPRFSLDERTHIGQGEGAVAQDFGYFSVRGGSQPGCTRQLIIRYFFYTKDCIAM